VITFDNRRIADLDFEDPVSLFSDLKIVKNQTHRFSIGLPAKMRMLLGQKLAAAYSSSAGTIEDVVLKLEVETGDNLVIRTPLQRWDRFDLGSFANQFFVSNLRFANPKFYWAVCQTLL
jgi:hypothetical protein